jgi:hypothetical protein
MLAEHGRMGSDYPEVLANTISAFALGDAEWLLAFEADDLVPIVDLMRHLRAAQARATHARSCRFSPPGDGRSPTPRPTAPRPTVADPRAAAGGP